MVADTKSPLEEFLASGKVILKKNGGVNDTAVRALTRLATRLDLSKEEVEASSDQLGLSRSEVRDIVKEGNLASENGGGGGVLKGLLALVFAVAAIAGAAWSVMTFWPWGDPNPQQIVQADPNAKPAEQPPENNPPKDENQKPPPNPQNINPQPVPNPQQPAVRKLDDRIVAALNSAARKFPDEKALFEQVRDARERDRGDAWQQLAGKFKSLVGRPDESDPVRTLLAVAYARENEDDHARAIRQGLLTLLPPTLPRVPANASDYDAAYWALHTAVDAAKHPDVSEARAESMLNDLDAALKHKLDRGKELAAFQKHVGDVLSQRFYTALIKSVGGDPQKSKGLRAGLVPWARNYVDEDLMQEFNGEFNDAIKKANPPVVVSNPKEPNPKNPGPSDPVPKPPVVKQPADVRVAQLQQTADSLFKRNQAEQKPEQSLQTTVELAHTSTQAIALTQKNQSQFDALGSKKPVLPQTAVQPVKPKEPPASKEPAPPVQPVPPNPGQPGLGFLGQPGQPIQVQPGQPPQPGQPGAGAVGIGGGGFLGQPPAPGPGKPGRPGQLPPPQQPPLGQPPAQFQGGFLGQPVQAQGGVQGQPVQFGGGVQAQGGIQGQQVQGGFIGQPPAQVQGGGFVGQPPAQVQGGGFVGQPPVNPEQPKVPAQFTNKEWTDMAVRAIDLNRSSSDRLQGLNILATSSEEKDLPSVQAEVIARFLLSMHPQELQAALPVLGNLARFRNVSLALADVMEEKAPTAAYMEVLLTNMLREEVKLGKDAGWRKKARATLLGMALPKAEAIPPGDAAGAALRGSYAEQAKLLGFDAPDKTETQTSRVLESLILSMASRLGRQDLPRLDKRFVDKISDELIVARFVAVDDLHRTVVLQRLWVKLLRVHIGKQAPSLVKQADAICQALDAALRRQQHVLRQMAANEEHILRLWLLVVSEPEATASR